MGSVVPTLGRLVSSGDTVAAGLLVACCPGEPLGISVGVIGIPVTSHVDGNAVWGAASGDDEAAGDIE